MSAIGTSIKRADAPPKLTGLERYAGDLRFAGLLHARPVGSVSAHSKILGIDATAAMEIPGVVAVVTAGDLPITRDANGNQAKTAIANGEALYVGHPVAIVLAETESAAQDGALAVIVDEEPLPVVSTLEAAMEFDAPLVLTMGTTSGDDEAAMHNADADADLPAETSDEPLPPNVSGTAHFVRGDVEAAFRDADEVVEFKINSDTVHQGYLETQACLVNINALGSLDVYTSTQAAFHCRNKVAETVGLPIHRVNVVPMPVGGGFGGKFVLIEPLVAAVAIAVGRPVLLQYTRMEDFLAANPAPDCEISIKIGGTRDGRITALQSTSIFDAGAGGTSPLDISMILMGGYYKIPNIDMKGFQVVTHKAGAGAYRAPGAQQGSFAVEVAVDDLARKLGHDPLDFRIQNCVEEGDMRPNGRPWPRIGLRETLEALRDHPAWSNREQAKQDGRGVGVAIGGWPGGVEPATAVCRLDADGTITVVLGSVDLNGTNTAFSQIAAESLGLEANDVAVTTGSTDAAPFAGGTGGSKITYTVGPAVQQAADDARQQILDIAAQHLEAAVEDLEIANGRVQVKGVPGSGVSLKEVATMTMSVAGKYEPVYGTGKSAITEVAPGFAVHLAEVKVDDLTGETTVTRYVAAQDVGFAINPALVDGQIHGAVAQGLGWALHEALVFDRDGQPLTATLMDYVLPRANMVPPIETIHVNVPSEHGAYGSKGVGEPPAIPGPGAVSNAIRDAIGVRITQLPIKPEVVVTAMAQNGH